MLLFSIKSIIKGVYIYNKEFYNFKLLYSKKLNYF